MPNNRRRSWAFWTNENDPPEESVTNQSYTTDSVAISAQLQTEIDRVNRDIESSDPTQAGLSSGMAMSMSAQLNEQERERHYRRRMAEHAPGTYSHEMARRDYENHIRERAERLYQEMTLQQMAFGRSSVIVDDVIEAPITRPSDNDYSWTTIGRSLYSRPITYGESLGMYGETFKTKKKKKKSHLPKWW